MSNTRISEKLQRLGNALQVLGDEFQELREELEVKEPPVRKRRNLKAPRKAYYSALIKSGKS